MITRLTHVISDANPVISASNRIKRKPETYNDVRQLFQMRNETIVIETPTPTGLRIEVRLTNIGIFESNEEIKFRKA